MNTKRECAFTICFIVILAPSHLLTLYLSLFLWMYCAHYAKMKMKMMVPDRNRALMIICCLSPAPRSLSMHLVHSSVLSSGFDSVCKRVLIIMITLIIYLFRHTLNTKLTHTRASASLCKWQATPARPPSPNPLLILFLSTFVLLINY